MQMTWGNMQIMLFTWTSPSSQSRERCGMSSRVGMCQAKIDVFYMDSSTFSQLKNRDEILRNVGPGSWEIYVNEYASNNLHKAFM